MPGWDPQCSPDERWIAYRTPAGNRIDLVSPDRKRHRRLARIDPTMEDAPIVWSCSLTLASARGIRDQPATSPSASFGMRTSDQ
jgi:hypothetical protein